MKVIPKLITTTKDGSIPIPPILGGRLAILIILIPRPRERPIACLSSSGQLPHRDLYPHVSSGAVAIAIY